MPSSNKATVGRKVWLWTNSLDGVLDANQAFDATVKYVHADGSVNVTAHTHTGAPMFVEALEVHDPSEDEKQPNHHSVTLASSYCTWMPYQKKQMDSQMQPSMDGAQKVKA